MISSLIDKQDNFEVVRDQIAAILASEVASQMSLATEAGKDAGYWKLRVYAERSNPWETVLNDQLDRSPIVNVWFDNASFDPVASNISERQKSEGVFNIDCYGFGVASDEPGGGHLPGDELAALEAHKASRLVRNILMAAEYTYLGLRGGVWQRWFKSVNVFQPQFDNTQAQQVVASRLSLGVIYNEFSPQVTGENLELVSSKVHRSEDGQIVINADYDYT